MPILITYFSPTGTTKAMAERMAEAIGADLYEIVPKTPYTNADLNWKNPLARCNKEKFGKKDVPVAGRLPDFTKYDRIIIGFPIWYYGAPNIIRTFAEQLNWKDKQIGIFATSGGSEMGKTAWKLAPAFHGEGRIVGAKRFSSRTDTAVLKRWGETIWK